MLEVNRSLRVSMRANRRFMAKAAGFLARRGIRQFVDVGTGLPTHPNPHEVVQRVAPEAKVVYVDNDRSNPGRAHRQLPSDCGLITRPVSRKLTPGAANAIGAELARRIFGCCWTSCARVTCRGGKRRSGTSRTIGHGGRTWGLWSNVGLRGRIRGGVAALDWASRVELRNTSFVQLSLSSGLRRQEGASLLTFEVPTQQLRSGRYLHGRVAGAVTRSKRDRTFYADALEVGQTRMVLSQGVTGAP